MAEKTPKPSGSSAKALPMKLFFSRDMGRLPSNSIARVCTLTVTRLVVFRGILASETSHVQLGVRSPRSRRTLRSHEIPVPENGCVNAELELTFSLQYPHCVKGEDNNLRILLQRSKKLTIANKVFAVGNIDLVMVLQKNMDFDLDLYPPDSPHEPGNEIAKVSIVSCCTYPIEDIMDLHVKSNPDVAPCLARNLETSSLNPHSSVPTGKSRSSHVNEFSSEDEEFSSGHSSDSPPDGIPLRKNSKVLPHGHRNLKSKVLNLLKRFKTLELVHRNEAKAGPAIGVAVEIDDLIEEMKGDFSDSEPEVDADTISVGSFPKPALPPFFSSSRSLVQPHDTIAEKGTSDEQKDSDSWTEPDQNLAPKGKTAGLSPPSISSPTVPASVTSPRGAAGNPVNRAKLGSISTQLSNVFPARDESFPSLVVLVSFDSSLAPGIYSTLVEREVKVIGIEAEYDMKTVFPQIVWKVQKFCNNNAKAPTPVTIVAVGNEAFLSVVTKNYVTQLSCKPHDWQSYFAFIYAPYTTGSSIWKLLCHKDPAYGDTFNDFTERSSAEDMALRIMAYTSTVMFQRVIVNIPIAEVMVMYRDEFEQSSQMFVPFISDLQLGGESFSGTMEHSEGTAESSSPPSPPHSRRDEPQDFQLDYWKDGMKSSVKSNFQSLRIQRSQNNENTLYITYGLREAKKQKMIRIGKKKEKETDVKTFSVDGIARVVCIAKPLVPIKISVDGMPYQGVKCFQVSPLWQTQVKMLPLLVSQSVKADTNGI